VRAGSCQKDSVLKAPYVAWADGSCALASVTLHPDYLILNLREPWRKPSIDKETEADG